ncbi:ribbon-helix-helix, copG family protein [Methyloversatilis sp. RAC08]|uniref:CopG family ribbon-helix-helix protein n=1 Tax=Methyloversatilis sp. RAC08 TaxID=1842540 RepID=UPI00083D7CA9|nr:ribbon-helix-helix domain-containing protein [Methyloversatilis sp. RAC08]AOF80668.1 ribbon-helix-helix, copG family protein [Methyloversatilis sp. RAC08]
MSSADTRVMTAHLPVTLAEQVDHLAARLERSRSWGVKQALAAYVEREADRYRLTLDAMADVEAGKGVSHPDVKAWAASLNADRSRLL